MIYNHNPYKEVSWSEEPPDVDDLFNLVRAGRGDFDSMLSILVRRSGGELTESYIRRATWESWNGWVKGMRTALDKANAPFAAKSLEQDLQGKVVLPPGLRLRVVPDESAQSTGTLDISKLMGGLSFGEQNDE